MRLRLPSVRLTTTYWHGRANWREEDSGTDRRRLLTRIRLRAIRVLEEFDPKGHDDGWVGSLWGT